MQNDQQAIPRTLLTLIPIRGQLSPLAEGRVGWGGGQVTTGRLGGQAVWPSLHAPDSHQLRKRLCGTPCMLLTHISFKEFPAAPIARLITQ